MVSILLPPLKNNRTTLTEIHVTCRRRAAVSADRRQRGPLGCFPHKLGQRELPCAIGSPQARGGRENAMKLILSDRPLSLPVQDKSIRFVDLSQLHIANCVGCFGCWTKTPGKCVIRDDAVKVYPLIAQSETVLYVSRIRYGGYDTVMKTMIERAIPVQQAFIRVLDGETHHVQRAVALKQATILAYGSTSPEEEELFRRLVARNAKNMNFAGYRVLFAQEDAVETLARQEVEAWQKS